MTRDPPAMGGAATGGTAANGGPGAGGVLALSHPHTLAGRYEIREAIGEGNFSVTYRATDRVLGRDVAVKVLREQYVQHAGFASRFENEARAAALISHPNVIQVFDYGREDDATYIVMQFVPGATLKDYIRENAPLRIGESVDFTRQILEGLAAIHDAGIIHRDIKPQNVLMADHGQLKLTDFGIARLGTAATGLTESGTALGTAAYMAPEQASGQEIGHGADLYAVGVVLYEMLTGQLPFPGDNPVQVMYRHVNEMPPPPRSLNPDIPVTIEAFVMRALAKEPPDRYPSARAMRDALVSPGIDSMARRRPPLVD
ncbi:MAG: protein kinase domain-containing protein, partial [Vicinamibacterales bacterium]